MVTLLRPHRHTHGPAAVSVRLSRSRSHQQLSSSSPPPPLPPFLGPFRSVLRPMAQDPSHPHRQSKETAAPPQQQEPEQPELAQPPPPPTQQQQPPREVQQEASTSSGGDSDAGSSWLQLGIGPSSTSPSSPRRKRQRQDDAGPSTSVQPAAPPLPPSPLPQLQLSLHPGPSSSSSAAPVGTVVAAAPPPPAHEAGTWFFLRAAQNQRREPPLPQIPRSYLRVRDGRMTVRVVMRYLVNKLGLDDDSQAYRARTGHRMDQITSTRGWIRDLASSQPSIKQPLEGVVSGKLTASARERSLRLIDFPHCRDGIIKIRSKKEGTYDDVYYKCPDNIRIMASRRRKGMAR
ncbi:hypothetical protein BS78_08G068300 [Paspalum vaginatum]|nr:hypothetical protein BS78_08G068300 [Paspalum vaginatum]